MSGPNTNLDPVEVAALSEESLAENVAEALAAVAAAHDLDSLKQVRLQVAGDRSPISLANREVGALPPTARREAGMRVGRGPQAGRRGARRSCRCSSRRSSPNTCWRPSGSTSPSRCRPPSSGARHPLEAITERMVDVFVAMGWEVAEGPEVEAEWFNFDALNFGPDHPARAMQDTFFVDPPEAGLVLRTHTSPVQARTLLERGARRCTWSARQGVPHRRARRHPHPGLPPDRGSGDRQGPDPGQPQGHPRPLRRGHVRGRHHDAPAALVLPLHRTERRARRPLLPVPGRRPGVPQLQGHGLDRVGRLRHGAPERADGPAGSTPTSTRGSPSAWASSGA